MEPKKKRIEYMKIAGDLCQFHFSHEQLDLLVSLYELIDQKGGDVNIRDVSTIQYEVREREIEAQTKAKKSKK